MFFGYFPNLKHWARIIQVRFSEKTLTPLKILGRDSSKEAFAQIYVYNLFTSTSVKGTSVVAVA